jgi:AmpD protein
MCAYFQSCGAKGAVKPRRRDLEPMFPFQLNVETGWLEGVCQIPSPNCDDRPPDAGIELVVVHGISLPPGEYGGDAIDKLFTNALSVDAHPYFAEIAHLRVSTHALIKRTGVITQYVPFHKRAWHAGVSCFQGRPSCNDFSIGIELEGSDQDLYQDEQYEALAGLTRILWDVWPGITRERVVGHSDIAPGRKTDPGVGFCWEKFHSLLTIKDL